MIVYNKWRNATTNNEKNMITDIMDNKLQCLYIEASWLMGCLLMAVQQKALSI